MDVLKGFNAKQLYRKLDRPDDEFREWLVGMGLLHKKRTCECGAAMRLRWRDKERFPVPSVQRTQV